MQAFLVIGADVLVQRNDAITVEQAQALQPTHLCISPGPCTPRDAGVSMDMICAFAGWALIGRIGSVSPTSGQLGNIESITAVVIGGISLFGGRGSILGAFFGALIVGVFTLGLRLLGADAQWTFLLIGLLIIGAVAVDQWIRKVSG